MACDPKMFEGGLDLDEICLQLPVDWGVLLGLRVPLVGGVTFAPILNPGDFPDVNKIVGDFLAHVNTALTPLVPLFRLTDVIVAVVDCIKALPDVIGPPPNIMPLVECAQKLLKAMGYIVQILPQISLPMLLQGICSLLVQAIRAVRDQIACLLFAKLRMERATARAEQLSLAGFAGAIKLLETITCTKVNYDNQLQGICVGTELLSSLVKLINLFLSLIGFPEEDQIPSPALLCDGIDNLTLEILAPLDEGLIRLQAVCSAIPSLPGMDELK